MELQKINHILQNVMSPDPKILRYIKEEKIRTPIDDDGYGIMGEQNEFCRIYEVIGETDLYLRIDYCTDSYGTGESIMSIQFVKPVQKSITAFESI